MIRNVPFGGAPPPLATSHSRATNEMIHTEHDAFAFAYSMLLVLGTLSAGVYAVAVLIALQVKAFRSRAAMYIWFALSAIDSIPFFLLCVLIVQIRRNTWGGNVGTA